MIAGRRIPHRGRLMVTLFAAQVCGSTGHSIGMAVGGIMAAAITGTNTWVGLPVGIGALGAALASWPLSRLMGRVGRRPGLTLGYGLAVLGAALGMVSVLAGSFSLLLVGMALFGIANTSNLLARYAAADITPSAHRGRAMGLIVWGSTLGSIIGPNLMPLVVHFGSLIGLSPVGSAFLISFGGYGLAAVLVEIFLRPDPLAIARELEMRATAPRPVETARLDRSVGSTVERSRLPRPLAVTFRDSRVQVALGTLMTSQLVMIGTTSTSPVYLHDVGYDVQMIGLAVAFHLGGMYIASPLSGWLADRAGRMPTIALGGLVLLVALAMAGLAPGHESSVIMIGLALNGIGWNLAFVAGSALLTDALSASERASMQGLADLVMGLMGALASAAGGMILGGWGFGVLNAFGAALVLVPLAATWLRRPALASAWTE